MNFVHSTVSLFSWVILFAAAGTSAQNVSIPIDTVDAAIGRDATFTCQVFWYDGETQVSWRLNGQALARDEDKYYTQLYSLGGSSSEVASILMIYSLESSDFGRYECHVNYADREESAFAVLRDMDLNAQEETTSPSTEATTMQTTTEVEPSSSANPSEDLRESTDQNVGAPGVPPAVQASLVEWLRSGARLNQAREELAREKLRSARLKNSILLSRANRANIEISV